MAEPREDASTAGPVTAYIVAGVNSSGNRLLASILVRSGCAGEGSTNQPMRFDAIPPPQQSVVIIKHGGLTGWIRSQYLMSEVPAKQRLSAATQKLEMTGEKSADLVTRVQALETEREDLLIQVTTSETELEQVRQELHQLKQISGKAVQLDTVNRQLVEEAENLRSKVEMLQAENQRLTGNLESEDFMNGAWAVLLGVIIALVAPRLVPKRRKTSSW